MSSKKKKKKTCTKCAYSGYHAHAQRFIRAFAFHSYIIKYLMIMFADSEGPDQTVRISSRKPTYIILTPLNPTFI